MDIARNVAGERNFAMRPTVLIADDDADQLAEMSEFLENSGFDVIKARDGHEAVELIAAHRPRLMMLDINMPGWDGVRVADAARNLDHRAVIVLMTGDVDALKHALSTDCGAIMAFPKPVELPKLMGFLKSTFGKAELEDAFDL